MREKIVVILHPPATLARNPNRSDETRTAWGERAGSGKFRRKNTTLTPFMVSSEQEPVLLGGSVALTAAKVRLGRVSRLHRRISSVRVSGEESHESLCCPGSANAVRTAVHKKGVEFLSRCHGSCDGIITLPPPNPSFDSSTVTAPQVQQRGVRFHGSREFTPSLWKKSTCVRKSSEANLARGRRFGWTGFISSLRGRELFLWRAENPTGRLHGKSASSRTRSRARAHPLLDVRGFLIV